MLYPLKFRPRLKEVIWGGDTLVKSGKKLNNKRQNPDSIGESWEISGVDGNVSVVDNGPLAGNNLQELAEVYMGDLMGEKIFDQFGLEFPLLLKFIDARDRLSVQVHPDDALASIRHNSRGKTEMWYVAEAIHGASLYVGFNRQITREEYMQAVAEGRLVDLLHRVEVHKGDTFFIPAGTVHAIGAGVLIAEIQETSDITYRIDDWGRVGKDGRPRELHTQLAVDAIDFGQPRNYDVTRHAEADTESQLVSCQWFTTSIINVATSITRDYAPLDSFVIYMCTEGEITVSTESGSEAIGPLQSVLIPAEVDEVILTGTGTLLEVYIK